MGGGIFGFPAGAWLGWQKRRGGSRVRSPHLGLQHNEPILEVSQESDFILN